MTPNFLTLKLVDMWDNTDFPEYGRQCELITSWRGYYRGTIVAKTAKGFTVQFSSGAEIDVYEDEIKFD